MAVGQGQSKSKRGRGGPRKPHGKCWNCGEKGHFKDRCPKPPKYGDKPKNNLKKGEASLNSKEKQSSASTAAAEDDSELEGVWVAMDTDDKSVVLDGFTSDAEALDSSFYMPLSFSKAPLDNGDWFSEGE